MNELTDRIMMLMGQVGKNLIDELQRCKNEGHDPLEGIEGDGMRTALKAMLDLLAMLQTAQAEHPRATSSVFEEGNRRLNVALDALFGDEVSGESSSEVVYAPAAIRPPMAPMGFGIPPGAWWAEKSGTKLKWIAWEPDADAFKLHGVIRSCFYLEEQPESDLGPIIVREMQRGIFNTSALHIVKKFDTYTSYIIEALFSLNE